MPPLADLLQQLHAIDHPYAPQFDDRLFVVVLLALAAGERNLVVRVAPQDLPALSSPGETKLSKRDKKEWVTRVADEVNWVHLHYYILPLGAPRHLLPKDYPQRLPPVPLSSPSWSVSGNGIAAEGRLKFTDPGLEASGEAEF
ncbi:hypothetical protein JCM1841_001553 [Sporobolomyces salmonicolor]